jgi:hypothetical protein
VKEKGTIVLTVTRAGMELCWLYGWAAFLTAAVLNRGFPLPEAVCAFFLAAMTMLTRWPGLGKWRILFIPLLHSAGFLLSAAIIVYAFTDGQHPFLGTGWLAAIIQQTQGVAGWFALGMIGCFVVVFWIGGLTFMRRPATAIGVGRRFDLGITAFLVLFIIHLFLVQRGGIQVSDPYSEMLIVPFFIFSLLAIGIVNQRSSTPKAFLSGFHWVGVISSFSLIAVCLAAAGFFFLLPFFTVAAEAGYSALKTATGPLGPVIVSILRFIFSPRRMRMDPSGQSPQPDNVPLTGIAETGASPSFLHSLIVWGLTSAMALLLLIGACVGLWYLWRWLWHKFSRAPLYDPRPGTFIKTLLQIWLRLCRMANRLIEYVGGYNSVVRLFDALVGWGRRSGVPRLAGETPLEYSQRLVRVFPLLHRQFGIIVEAYHKEVYADSNLDIEHFRAVQAAWRDLRSPRHWLMRIKAAFFGGFHPFGKESESLMR